MTHADGQKVLFFGRENCDGTSDALAHLKMLGFDVTLILSGGKGRKMPEEVYDWNGEYILCFRSYYILPKRLIERAQVAAINFHPASTDYPGSGCINFALYEGAERYGVTAHLINEKVDNGAVLDCPTFPIHPGDTLKSLLHRTHNKLLDLFLDIVDGLALEGPDFVHRKLEQNKDLAWRGLARRMKELDALQEVTPEVSEEELNRRIRAVHTPAFPVTLTLHGHIFALQDPTE